MPFLAKAEVEMAPSWGFRILEPDFLFDSSAIYDSIYHRFDDRKPFPVSNKPEVQISNVRRRIIPPHVTPRHIACILTKNCSLRYPFPAKLDVEMRQPRRIRILEADFLVDPNTMYGSICHRFDTRKVHC